MQLVLFDRPATASSGAERCRKWRRKNPERVKELRRQNRARDREALRRWRAKNPERNRELQRRSKEKNHKKSYQRYRDKLQQDFVSFPHFTWAKKAVQAAKYRAKNLNIPFDLTIEHIVSIIPDLCPITLQEFVFGAGHNNINGPSLDRFIPSLGYVIGNVRVISFYANTVKRDCVDPNIFERIAQYIRNKEGGRRYPSPNGPGLEPTPLA